MIARVRRDQGARTSRPTSTSAPGARAVLNYGHTRRRTRSRPRPVTRCCTARRSRSGSCSPAQLAARRSSGVDPTLGRAPRGARRARSGCRRSAPPGPARRRPARDHGARQEVGWWAHVRARRSERDRTGRRSRSGRGAQGARRDSSGGMMAKILLLSGPNLNLLGRARAGALRHDDARRARRAGERDRGQARSRRRARAVEPRGRARSTRSTARAAGARRS